MHLPPSSHSLHSRKPPWAGGSNNGKGWGSGNVGVSPGNSAGSSVWGLGNSNSNSDNLVPSVADITTSSTSSTSSSSNSDSNTNTSQSNTQSSGSNQNSNSNSNSSSNSNNEAVGNTDGGQTDSNGGDQQGSSSSTGDTSSNNNVQSESQADSPSASEDATGSESTQSTSSELTPIVNAAIPATESPSSSRAASSVTEINTALTSTPTLANSITTAFSTTGDSGALPSSSETSTALRSNNGQLAPGAIAGIVIGLLVLLAAILTVFLRRRRIAKREERHEWWRRRLPYSSAAEEYPEENSRSIRNSQRSSFGTLGASITDTGSFATFDTSTPLVPNMAEVRGGQPLFATARDEGSTQRHPYRSSQLATAVTYADDVHPDRAPSRASVFTVGSLSTLDSQNPFSDPLSEFPEPPSHTTSQIALSLHTPTASLTKLVLCHQTQFQTTPEGNQVVVHSL